MALILSHFITLAFGASDRYPVIDVHVHLSGHPSTSKKERLAVDRDRAADIAVSHMDANHVRTSIVMPTPTTNARLDYRSLITQAKRYPERLMVLGGGALLNPMIQHTVPQQVTETQKRIFEARAESILRGGAIGFGEMAALHFSFFQQHPFENAPPDHPLFLLLADIAARHDVPIDLHHEIVLHEIPVPAKLRSRSKQNPRTVGPNVAALERLLAHNPGARIILSHSNDSTGHRTAETIRGLLERHPNMYMSLNVLPKFLFVENLPLKGSGDIHPGWKKLIEDLPDRFLIGSDQFYAESTDSIDVAFACGSCTKKDTATASLRWLKFLPPDVARKVAYENAEQVFRLNDRRKVMAAIRSDPRAPGSAETALGTSEQQFLREAEIRKVITGNTLNFTAPLNGREHFVYFDEGGSVVVGFADSPGKSVTKTWFINQKEMLCRTVGRHNANHCTHVEARGDDDKLTLSNASVSYEVKILRGRQLPK